MQTALFTASKAEKRPLKRAWAILGQNLGGIGATLGQNWGRNIGVTLGQNWGGIRESDEGKAWVKWGWKIDLCHLDESWIKLGWKSGQGRGEIGAEYAGQKADKVGIETSVWHRGRDGYLALLSLGKGLYSRRPKGDQNSDIYARQIVAKTTSSNCSGSAVNLQWFRAKHVEKEGQKAYPIGASHSAVLKHKVNASLEAQLRAERGIRPPQLAALCSSVLWDAGSGCPFLYCLTSSDLRPMLCRGDHKSLKSQLSANLVNL